MIVAGSEGRPSFGALLNIFIRSRATDSEDTYTIPHVRLRLLVILSNNMSPTALAGGGSLAIRLTRCVLP